MLALSALLGACDDGECERAACESEPFQVAVVDDAGDPLAVKGEYRISSPGREDATVSFECHPEQADESVRCFDNELTVGPAWADDFEMEVRFELADGELSEWQPVALEITSETDPDYNGPGCACTTYSASAEPIVVPEEARL